MNVFLLALRNLMRNRRRSLTTLLAMIVGLVAILLFGGYSSNVILAMQTGYVQAHGHFQLQHKDYFLYGSGNPAAYGIADYQRIIDTVKKDPVLAPMLTIATPRLQLSGIAGNFAAGVSKTVLAAGVQVDDQNKLRAWDDYGAMSFARPLALTGTAPDAVVIGTGVARILQLCGPLKVANCPQPAPKAETAAPSAPDDIAALSSLEKPADAQQGGTSIEMLAANLHGAPNVGRLNVVKAENQGLKEIDDYFMIMHLPQAQRLLYGSEKPQVTAIQLQLQHTSQMPAAKARLDELLSTTLKDADLELQDFQTLAPIYGQTIQFFKSVFGFIATLIGVIVLFTVGNTMSMAVVERTVEIGTLRAVGQRRGGIRTMFVCEGMMLGVIGSLLGVTIALGLSWLINHSGLTWTPPGYVYAYPVQTRVWGETGLILGSMAGMVAVAVISAWWPANRGAKMLIVDALRHV
ncbi:MAG TPA: FtsX-like permease family protein [Noviherbaspirillum sp.]|uniref:ABC transporter permease n=1 Tax=Noviherbaspirillum sp. TaxID=1926288 RepID=UPI002B496B8D|nr:FtsX-like permease family protein [Noviherbaspirillum sp.]HJV86462.1 FtsX-like permease family protein [Noviherbaspirillum sp.]